MANERTDRSMETPTTSERDGRKLSDVMTRNPECATEKDTLQSVARMMRDCDCGAIPVVGDDRKLRGMITDRDIVIRCIAEGKNPMDATVGNIMTREIYSVRENESLDEVFRVMSERQVRRVPILGNNDEVIGIIAQADLAIDSPSDEKVGRTVEHISEPDRPRAGR
ncbi:MAG TPA: CBS domain-containing protein [Thermoanaerobaculia bacterium]|nr:CBS domain-containing protein [Thermoanaerobaculia bacterium]